MDATQLERANGAVDARGKRRPPHVVWPRFPWSVLWGLRKTPVGDLGAKSLGFRYGVSTKSAAGYRITHYSVVSLYDIDMCEARKTANITIRLLKNCHILSQLN